MLKSKQDDQIGRLYYTCFDGRKLDQTRKLLCLRGVSEIANCMLTIVILLNLSTIMKQADLNLVS